LERLETLIETHGQRVMRLLRRMLGDTGLAEDAWQETWGAVWKALPRLRTGSDPWPFVRQTAKRKAVDAARRAKSARLTTGSDPEPAWRAPVAPAPVDLAFLPPEQRECLALFFWGGLSVREIAAKLSVPEGTVKTWMFRGRERLRARARSREEKP
jgi:DNA-directed RNA polymerase specialized sigma24 family protein